MQHLREDEPPRGVALPVAPGVRRVVAANPGPMTYHGTNTYLLDWADGVAVLDPGPDDARHVADVQRLAGGPIRAILLTHGHHDHYGALAALRGATGAPVHGWHQPAASGIDPDVALQDGDAIGDWTVLHTPGHAPDHICLLGPDGTVFSGDHVMGWSTTVVGGPSGDMAAYFRSLERLMAVNAAIYLPGHGPAIHDPAPYASALLTHRRMREGSILRALSGAPAGIGGLVDALYPQLEPALRGAAERNVLAHLAKLEGEGRVRRDGAGWRAAE